MKSGRITTAVVTYGTLSPAVVGLSLSRWHSWDAPLASVAVLYLVAAAAWLAIDLAGRVQLEGYRPLVSRASIWLSWPYEDRTDR